MVSEPCQSTTTMAGSKSPGKSKTPTPRAAEQVRGRSLSRRGGHPGTREIIVREVVREGGSGGGGGGMHMPMLTRTNCVEWAILMRVQLQGA